MPKIAKYYEIKPEAYMDINLFIIYLFIINLYLYFEDFLELLN